MAKLDFDRNYGVSAVLFDTSVKPFSPVFGDQERKVYYDEEGKEIVSFVPVDYKAYADSVGSVFDWSLDALVKAGINPNFPIHTSNSVSRIEGVNDIQSVSEQINLILDSKKEDE